MYWFPLSLWDRLWEVWFCPTLGVPSPALIGPSQQCACNSFHHDSFGDHLETSKVKSTDSQVHDWVVYHLGDIFGSVGHRVKIHKITPTTGKERGDLEIKNYVVLLILQVDYMMILVVYYFSTLTVKLRY